MEKLKIIFLIDQFPFPRRNGITANTSAIIQELSKVHDIDLLILKEMKEEFDVINFSPHEVYIDTIYSVTLKKHSLVLRILNEMCFIKPSFASLDKISLTSIKKAYNIAWCSPIMPFSQLHDLAIKCDFSFDKSIAAISDIYSIVLSNINNKCEKTSISCLFNMMVNRIRSKIMIKHEKNILCKTDFICVQSKHEKDWIRNKFPKEMYNKTRILPNSVSDKLFIIDYNPQNNKLLFVGIFTGEYVKRINWFIDHVWEKIQKLQQSISMTIVGRKADTVLKNKFLQKDINHIEYIENIEQVYRNSGIFIAPIFKGFGLITKVIEAMASGLIVIGDETAFNGIEGFINMKHGIIANTAIKFIEMITLVVSNVENFAFIRFNARNLIKKQFSLKDQIKKVETIISDNS
jgi:glycosyltransferase involved in cell wall biosynthesis